MLIPSLRPSRWLLCLFAAAILPPGAALASVANIDGINLFDESDYSAFTVTDDDDQRIHLTEVAAQGPGFNRALRLATRDDGASFPKIGATLRNTDTLARGAVLFATFFIRTVESPRESGEGWTQFELEDRGTFAISGQFAAHATNEWREIQVPLRVVRDCPPGRATINFRVGDQRQVIEIGGLRVIQPPAGVTFASLPATSVQPSYEGSEPDAGWRAAARERIEQYRRSDLRVTVFDAEGRPAPGALVRVRQQSHAYRFGAAVRADAIAATTPQAEAYRENILRLFSAITFENDLKWQRWLDDRDTPMVAARWAEAHGLALRGHTMIWATNSRLPEQFQSERDRPDRLAPTLVEHIRDIGFAMSPHIDVWDVLNEPFRNRDFMNLLGDRAMVDWFKAAKLAAPEAKLFVNDYGIVSGGGMDARHQDSYERNVEFLLGSGAPLEGLGFQGHFGRILTPPERLLSILDRYGRFGLEMELTEYSTQIDDPHLSASYLRDMLLAFFSHPQTTGFILWGFQEGHGFKHSAALLTKDGRLTPCGEVWRDLVLNDWWTNAQTTSDEKGSASVRAFHGRHEIQVVHAGATASVSIQLNPDTPVIEIRLPVSSQLSLTP